jgi:hypothetical protein
LMRRLRKRLKVSIIFNNDTTFVSWPIRPVQRPQTGQMSVTASAGGVNKCIIPWIHWKQSLVWPGRLAQKLTGNFGFMPPSKVMIDLTNSIATWNPISSRWKLGLNGVGVPTRWDFRKRCYGIFLAYNEINNQVFIQGHKQD